MDDAKNEKQFLEFWEEKFPGKGEAMVKILQPFSDWIPDYKAAMHNLDQRSREAIFWMEIKEVKRIHLGDGSFMEFLQDSTCIDIQASYFYSSWSPDQDEGTSKEVGERDEEDDDEIGDAVVRAISESLECPGLMDILFRGCIADSFFGILYLPAMYTALGLPKMAQKFTPLQELWLARNWVLGINEKEGILYVQVANLTN